jgi:hypothetical protein
MQKKKQILALFDNSNIKRMATNKINNRKIASDPKVEKTVEYRASTLSFPKRTFQLILEGLHEVSECSAFFGLHEGLDEHSGD